MFERIIEYFPRILSKFPISFYIVVVSTSLALVLGTILALIRIRKNTGAASIGRCVHLVRKRDANFWFSSFWFITGIPLLSLSIFGKDITMEWNN